MCVCVCVCVFFSFLDIDSFLAFPGAAHCLSLSFLSASVGRTVCLNFIASGHLSCLLEPSPWNPGATSSPAALSCFSECPLFSSSRPGCTFQSFKVSLACQLMMPFFPKYLGPCKNFFYLCFIECDLVFSFCGELLTCSRPEFTSWGLVWVFEIMCFLQTRLFLRQLHFFLLVLLIPGTLWRFNHCLREYTLPFRFLPLLRVEQKISAFSLATYLVRALELAWYMPFWGSAFEWMTSHKTSGLWCSAFREWDVNVSFASAR